MTGGERMHAYPRPATKNQPGMLVLSPHRNADDMQASGEWIAAEQTVDVER